MRSFSALRCCKGRDWGRDGRVKRDDLESFIEMAYAAAAGEASWADLLASLTTACDSAVGVLMSQDLTSGTVRPAHVVGLGAEPVRLYASHYKDKSLLLADALRRPAADVYTDGLYPDQRGYRDSEAYRDYFRRFDADHLMQVFLRREGTAVDTLLLRRPASVGPYRAAEVRRFEVLAGHLRRAHHLTLLAETERRRADLWRHLSDGSGQGLVVVDDRLHLVCANGGGQAFLESRADLTLAHGTVQGRTSAVDASLRAGVRQAAEAARGAPEAADVPALPWMRLSGPDGEVVVTLQPLPRRLGVGGEGPAVALRILPTRPRGGGAGEALHRLYGLSRAEVRIAEALADGATVAEMAEAFGVTVNTVRHQLKQVLAKTDGRRQSDVVALVLRLRG